MTAIEASRLSEIERMKIEDILSLGAEDGPDHSSVLDALEWLVPLGASHINKFSPDEMGQALILCDAMERFAVAVRRKGHEEAMLGRMPTGYKLVATQQNRKWANPTAVLAVLAKLPGIVLSSVAKPLTPAQIEQRLDAESCAMLEEFVTFTPPSTSLVRSSNRKPEIAVLPDEPIGGILGRAATARLPELRTRRPSAPDQPSRSAPKPAGPSTARRQSFGRKRRKFGARWWNRY